MKSWFPCEILKKWWKVVQKLNSNRKNAAGAESMVDGGIMCCAKYNIKLFEIYIKPD